LVLPSRVTSTLNLGMSPTTIVILQRPYFFSIGTMKSSQRQLSVLRRKQEKYDAMLNNISQQTKRIGSCARDSKQVKQQQHCRTTEKASHPFSEGEELPEIASLKFMAPSKERVLKAKLELQEYFRKLDSSDT